jgi:hypothetical protein
MRRRRIIRRAIRRPPPGVRRRPLGRPGLRIVPVGQYAIYHFEETGNAIKLHRDDIRKIVEKKDKPIREMSEEELLAAMEELGIEGHEITDDDMKETETAAASKKETTMDDLEMLEKLTEMLYKGFITDEEYQQKKKDILGLD